MFQQQLYAFLAGLITLLLPERFFYSNLVMSDLPTIFFGLLFATLLLSALEDFSWKRLASTMLAASFLALLRPENIITVPITAGFLCLKIKLVHQIDKTQATVFFRRLGIAFLAGLVPLLLWCIRNQNLHGNFGLSNYAGEVLYTGWIYYGEASHISITDQNSDSVKRIQEAMDAYEGEINYKAEPTGWELYPVLINYGYESNQAFELLGDAAMDSIQKDRKITAKVLTTKLRKSLIPEAVPNLTFPLPGEESGNQPLEDAQSIRSGLQEEVNHFPVFIPLQRSANSFIPMWYQHLYQPVFLLSLGMLFLAVYQKRFFVWAPIVVITASRIFIPIIYGLGNWRYAGSGLVFLPIFVLLAIYTLAGSLAVL